MKSLLFTAILFMIFSASYPTWTVAQKTEPLDIELKNYPYPYAVLVPLEGVGHVPHLEVYDLFWKSVSDFLNKN